MTEAERRLRALVESDAFGVVVADDTRIREANDAFLAIVGRSRAELLGGGLPRDELTPPEWLAVDAAATEYIKEHGWAAPYEKEYVRPDGTRVPVMITPALLSAEPFELLVIVVDVSDRRAVEQQRERALMAERRAREEAEAAAERVRRLLRVTSALSGAVSVEELGRVIVEQAVEMLGASAGAFALAERDALVVHNALGYADGETGHRGRVPRDRPGPLADAVRTGGLVLLTGRADWARYPDAEPPRHAAFAGVPFVFAGEALGAMALSFEEPRELDAEDRGFLLALGRLGAQALERSRLYDQRAYVARTLQEGLLPDRLAEAPGLEVAVRYHSIADGGEVGGDFYDFFAIGGGRWVAATGDVAGKGTAAAVLTGLARHTLRAIAAWNPEPEAMLRFVNEALRVQSPGASFCTVGCAVLTANGGGFRARLSAGGHPSPVLRRRGARAEEVPVRGMLLGIEPDPALATVDLALGRGDVLVSYTDGVTDARDGRGRRFGEERLLAAVDTAPEGGADALAEAVDAAVLEHEDEGRRDDRCILVVRVRD